MMFWMQFTSTLPSCEAFSDAVCVACPSLKLFYDFYVVDAYIDTYTFHDALTENIVLLLKESNLIRNSLPSLKLYSSVLIFATYWYCKNVCET